MLRHLGAVLPPTRFAETGFPEVYPLWFQRMLFRFRKVLDSSGSDQSRREPIIPICEQTVRWCISPPLALEIQN
jgi:hypothetical protein